MKGEDGVENQALVCGAGGFIGSHLVRRLKREGFWVRGVDLKFPRFSETEADDFVIGDLRDAGFVALPSSTGRFDEVYQLAADMGGAGYIFTGEHDADIMHNSATINLNIARRLPQAQHRAASSIPRRPACTRSTTRRDPDNPNCAEDSAYPAAPDSEYGWEKLFSERLYLAYNRNHGMRTRDRPLPQHLRPGGHLGRRQGKGAGRDLPQGGRGRATAARSRSGATASRRARSSTSTNASRARAADALGLRRAGQHRLRGDGHDQPARRHRSAEIAGKRIAQAPHRRARTGVRGRNSDNRLIRETLGWAPSASLRDGLERTYAWIDAAGHAQRIRQR